MPRSGRFTSKECTTDAILRAKVSSGGDKMLAGRQGLEPRYADPESAVLPLDDLPGRRFNSNIVGKSGVLHWSLPMAISKDLLEILVCPLCKAPVELKQDENGLKCVECKRVYPIRDDIPVMLVDEARIEE